jgi:D-serine deaminase-like pyridoxal phosphate-dependent protein
MPHHIPALAATLRDVSLPAAFVDLDAFDANAAALEARAGGLPIRVASKSVRCPALLRRVLARPGWKGILAYDAREAAALVAEGFDDVVVAYPTADPHHLAALADASAGRHRDAGSASGGGVALIADASAARHRAAGSASGGSVALVVDDPGHVRAASRAAVAAGADLALWIDLDVALRLPGLHFGVRRSPVHDAGGAVALARAIAAAPGVHLGGLMAYEAQIAGVPDRSGRPVVDALVGVLKAWSRRDVSRRRGEVVGALRDAGFAVTRVNGGGTGSLAWSARDPSLTELSAGSGLYLPASFDGFRDLGATPAAGFALRVARVPGPGFVTCAGGGYPASGAAGADRLPRPWWPPGLALTPHEGAGEVQTPLRAPRDAALGVGDVVIFRHAKAGELAERFDRLMLVREGKIMGEAPTYRGLGWSFG